MAKHDSVGKVVNWSQRSTDNILRWHHRLDGYQDYFVLSMESTFLHKERKVRVVFALQKFTDLVGQYSLAYRN